MKAVHVHAWVLVTSTCVAVNPTHVDVRSDSTVCDFKLV